MDYVQEEQASTQQFLIRFVKVYLYLAKPLPLLRKLLLINVTQGLENVADVRAPTHQYANRLLFWLGSVVLEDVGCWRHPPELNVSDLVYYLHYSNQFKSGQIIHTPHRFEYKAS